MGKLGKGYGSEYHLPRYRAERAADLDAALLTALGPDVEGATIESEHPAPDSLQPCSPTGSIATDCHEGVIGSVTRMGIDCAELTEAVTAAGFDVVITK